MSTHETTEKKHTGFGDKVKGAAHVVHGIGEDFRGSVMSAFESVSGSDEAKVKDDDIAAKGKAEIARGVAQMKGASPPSGPQPHSDVKTDEQPQKQSTREEAVGSTPAPPPSPVETRQPQPETVQQQPVLGQTGGTEKVQQNNTQGTQATFDTTPPQLGEQGQSGGTQPFQGS